MTSSKPFRKIYAPVIAAAVFGALAATGLAQTAQAPSHPGSRCHRWRR